MLPINCSYSLPSPRRIVATSDGCRPLLDNWQTWATRGDRRTYEQRDQAVKRLEDYIQSNGKKLDLSQLHLTVLPEHWPVSLKRLDVSFNRLSQLPKGLPDSLEKLDVSFNQLRLLPNPLPNSLQVLKANDNQLIQLPTVLPVSLKQIDVSFNELRKLPPSLPCSLYLIYAQSNQLTELTMPLPESLMVLDVSSNQLTTLAGPLPASLIKLYINDNPITRLPAHLPVGLAEVEIEPSLRADLIHLLPHLYNASFVTKIAEWTTNTAPWKVMRYRVDAQLFGNFLQQLKSGRNSKNQLLKQRVAQLLDYLVQEENKTLREQLFLVAAEADADCVDRASFYFNQMYVAMLEHQLISSNASVTELFQTNLTLFRLQLLEKLAAEKAVERQKQSPDFSEEIEIYLAYQCKLRNALSLPIYTELHHPEIAKITDHDLEVVLAQVLEQEKKHFIRYLVTESTSWRMRLDEWDHEKVQAVNAAYLDTLASEAFHQRISRILSEDTFVINDSDARRIVEKQQAEELLYQQRYQLSRLFLAEQQAVDLINGFDHPKDEI